MLTRIKLALADLILDAALLATGSAIGGLLWFAIGLAPVTAAIAGTATFCGLIGVAWLSK